MGSIHDRETKKQFDVVKPEGGEGDHEADARYREETERFIASGRVDEAAREAKKAYEENPAELEEAEEIGKSKVAEEDPEVRRK